MFRFTLGMTLQIDKQFFFKTAEVEGTTKRGWPVMPASRQKKRSRPKGRLLVCMAGKLLAAYSCDTWEHLTLDSLEKCTTTGRDVRNLISETELVDTSYRVTTTDE